MMPIRLAVAIAILMGLIVAVLAATTITVVQRGLAFDRASVALAKGDRLDFTNDDDAMHNIHIFGPGNEDNVDLGLQKPGKLLGYKFDKAGAYRVRCNIHPSMKMAVTVK
jgi:plastocyanin